MWQRIRAAIKSHSSRAAVIPFADVKPRGTRLAWFWHGIGMDRRGFIYLAIGNAEEVRGGFGDVLIFEYDPCSGQKRYLDSACNILAKAGNLGPNEYWPGREAVAKVHSDIIEHDGVLYFTTHDLHNPKNLHLHRGGHFMSFDPETQEFSVLSADCPGGVAVENEGIIALNVLRNENLLVGWTYPHGHVLLFDPESGAIERYRRALDAEGSSNVARVVAVTPSGSIIVSYTGLNAPSCFFRLDRELGRLVRMDYAHDMGFFEGLAQLRDGSRIFMVDTNGELYVIHCSDDRIERLGSILPPAQQDDGEQVAQLRNMTLSPDESKLFFIPTRVTGGSGAYHLYEYEIASGEKRLVDDLRPVLKDAMLTGNGVMDRNGRLYLSCYFGNDKRMFRRYGELSGLARVDVSDRFDLPPRQPDNARHVQ